MIYANQTIHGDNFPLLMQTLSALGVAKESLEIAVEYLNLDNSRDNRLLDQIQEQNFSKYYQFSTVANKNLEKAIKKEINRLNSDELEERFILLIHAIGGLTCTVLGLHDVCPDYQKCREKTVKALHSRFGNDGEAIWIAMTSARQAAYKGNLTRIYNPEKAKPEILLKAISYSDNYFAKLYLLISVMNQLPPIEKVNPLKALFTGKQLDALTQQTLNIMDEVIIPERASIPEKKVYLTALALASGYDEKYSILFKKELAHPTDMAQWVLHSEIDKDRILNLIESIIPPTPGYIDIIANASTDERYYSRNGALKNRDAHLKVLAQKFPEVYQQQMLAETDITVAQNMEKVLQSVDHSYQGGTVLRDKARQHCASVLTERNPDKKYEIKKFLLGSLSMEKLLEFLPELNPSHVSYYGNGSQKYVSAYGLDDFAERCICYRVLEDADYYDSLGVLPGYEMREHEAELIDILRKHHVPMHHMLNGIVRIAGNYCKAATILENITKKLCEFADEIAELDLNSLTLTVDARCARIHVLGKCSKVNPKKYQAYLFAAADDSSKAVRETAVEYLPLPDDELNPDILALLKGKKIAKREIAVTLLEKKFPEAYKEAVQQAFASEKNEKLKTRLATLLNEDIPEEMKQASAGNLINELSKGNKAKKVAWLFENPFTPVHDKAGNEVEEKYLIALTNCYASMGQFTRSAKADQIAEGLNAADVEHFAQEVFSRFIDRGAEAKQKWVIYFTGIHGGFEAITSLQHYIKEWSECSRGAIASEAVKALAFNGSSSALMAVDGMARKFKNKQVRSAANIALQEAAEALNITREELADRIVPDLGFDESLCRIFDYGSRQFKVYLTPALELEIFEGEKKLKNLPKPGKNDDPEKSEQASKNFKEMKKQMKTVVQSQKARLEYVLLCDRKWSVDGWKELFIQKPVMHCFAIGLIWGAYDENNQLLQTFRYLEDGSFTTSDEDEYELPENIRIGLVHPIELDEETRSAWNEQLSDYEITQPFQQINRPIYRVLPEEIGKNALQRFSGTEINNLSLVGKMTKLDWYKGDAQDGGAFCEFYRTDIAKQEKQGDKVKQTGYYVELKFSGMYIATGYSDSEDVTIEEVRFWTLNTTMIEKNTAMKLDSVNPRYFSEIIAQLTGIFGGEKTDEA